MTKWIAQCGDILDVAADALVCSANPQLNLSGGVGGAFALRYGEAMQAFLRDWLSYRKLQFVTPGEVVVAPSCGSSFRRVIHAVAIDVFYATSAEVIDTAYKNAFAAARDNECRNVVTACLACGYGRATSDLFVDAIRPFVGQSLAGIDRVTFISRDADLVAAIQRCLTC